MSTNLIDKMTEREAKHVLNDIASVFGIGGAARTASVILRNVENSANDEFCRHRRVIEFLECKTFRLVKKANWYIFTRPYAEVDTTGETILEAVEKAMDYEEQD